MRNVDLHQRFIGAGDRARIARLTRHLEGRLLDFGPGGPEVLECDQEKGCVCVRFPGREGSGILTDLRGHGILAEQEDGQIRFWLHPAVQFEDLDYVWGCLFEILS